MKSLLAVFLLAAAFAIGACNNSTASPTLNTVPSTNVTPTASPVVLPSDLPTASPS